MFADNVLNYCCTQVQGNANFESGLSVRGRADMSELHVRDVMVTSDARCKKDINSLPDEALEVIKRLKIYSYVFRADPEQKTRYGPLAQEVRID